MNNIEDKSGFIEIEKNIWKSNIQNEWELENQKVQKIENICETFDCAVIAYPQDRDVKYCLIL